MPRRSPFNLRCSSERFSQCQTSFLSFSLTSLFLNSPGSISKPLSPEQQVLFSDMVSVPTSGKQIKDERETFKNFLQAINLMPRVAKQQDTASTFSVSTKLRYLHVHLVDGGFDNLAKKGKGKGKNRIEAEDPTKRRRQVNTSFLATLLSAFFFLLTAILKPVWWRPKSLLGSLRLDYKHEIEYEYNFRISNQCRFQSPRSSC